MDFFLNDFTQDAQNTIKDNFNFDENEPCATLYFENDTENCSHVAGTWDKIQEIIPILKEMGYDDFHLYYDDADIWVLYYHDPELDNLVWKLIR